MSSKMAPPPPSESLSYHAILNAAILILLVLFILMFTTYWFFEEKARIDQRFEQEVNVSQSILTQSTRWIDRGNYLYEITQNPDILEAILYLRDAYKEAGNDISAINLSDLDHRAETRLHGQYEFYIISSDGVIVSTTYPNDLGLDFRTLPGFYEKIQEMQKSGRFYPDRSVHGVDLSKKNRKYGYISTHDHQWLLEVSKEMDLVMPSTSAISYDELIYNIQRLHPAITGVDLYNWMGESIASLPVEGNTTRDPDLMEKITRVYTTRAVLRESHPDDREEVVYTFLPLYESSAPSNSFIHIVARTTFSTVEREKAVQSLLSLYILVNVITLLLAFCFAFYLSRRIIRPLSRIVEDINRIAHGDLNHRIRATGAAETRQIEQSINMMIGSLKETISALHQSKSELKDELLLRRRAEEKYQTIFTAAYDAIVLIEDGIIREINPEVSHLLGYPDHEVVGKTLLDFSPGIQSDGTGSTLKLEELISHVIDGGFVSTEWGFTRSDGELVETEVHLTRIRLSRNVLVQAIFHDITMENRAKRLLFEMNRRLEDEVRYRTRELEATVHELDSFTYTVSHDLRAPVRSIDGFSHILGIKAQETGNEEIIRYVQKIRDSTRMMDHLIDDLLDFSRVSRKVLDNTPIDMQDLVGRIVTTMTGSIPGCRVDVTVGHLPETSGDPALIRQVLVNLLSNAFKFTQNVSRPVVEIGSIFTAGRWVYFIRDNGIGFDMANANQIFDVFIRLNPVTEYEGTGVGLAIVKRIIIRHGGLIWAESRVNEGSTFYFTLHDPTVDPVRHHEPEE